MSSVKNNILSNSEVVVRYVGGAHIDPKTNEINGSAFERSPKDKDGVSFNRRNIFCYFEKCDRENIISIMKTRMNLGKKSRFAEIIVGDVLAKMSKEDGISIDFYEDFLDKEPGIPSNPAHALLKGLPFTGEKIGSLDSELAGDLLRQCIVNEYPTFP